MYEYLNNALEQLITVIDAHGTAQINLWLPAGKKIKSLFRKIKHAEKETGKKWKLPNGQVVETY